VRLAFDTNILAYAEGLGDEKRCRLAISLVEQLADNHVILPAQALGELTRILTIKAQRPTKQVRTAVLGWADSYDVAGSSWQAFAAAIDLVVDHQIPMWDALILAVAAENHCRLLLSEDFQDGFTWRGVTLVNPFASVVSPLLANLLHNG
jgi:predicted nucleic acid-binding protein